MFRYAASRCVVLGTAAVLVIGAAAGPGLAQMQAPPAGKPPAEQTTMGMLQGAVKNVDPGAGTLQVSTGPFGMLRKTLEVTGDTQIQVEGRQATLADIREGATIKASYEMRETKNVATKIEVTPSPQGSGNPSKSQ